MLEFIEEKVRARIKVMRGKHNVADIQHYIDKWALCYVENGFVFNATDLRQIAAKLLELNGGNTLQFIEQDDGVINIKHESGDAIGDLVKRDGIYRLTFLYTYDNADGLYQIADKLTELNKK